MADTSKQKLDRLAMKCWMDYRKTGISYAVYVFMEAHSFGVIQRQWAAGQMLLRVVEAEFA